VFGLGKKKKQGSNDNLMVPQDGGICERCGASYGTTKGLRNHAKQCNPPQQQANPMETFEMFVNMFGTMQKMQSESSLQNSLNTARMLREAASEFHPDGVPQVDEDDEMNHFFMDVVKGMMKGDKAAVETALAGQPQDPTPAQVQVVGMPKDIINQAKDAYIAGNVSADQVRAGAEKYGIAPNMVETALAKWDKLKGVKD